MSVDLPKYFLKPGYIFVSKKPYLLHTVLGSCVSVCFWDEQLKIASMNHIIYDKPFTKEQDTRFANISIPYMLKLMKDKGCLIENIKADIIGGAHNPLFNNILVSKNNIEMAEKVLKKYEIRIRGRDVGGEMGRKVIFNTETGEILIYKVNKVREDDWYEYH
ncbi:chemotaxis protein CheD [Natronospora cellulosivora (SeqCode)]